MKSLKNNQGGMGILIFGLFGILFVFVIAIALFQNYSVLAAAYTVRSSMEKTALTIVARQTETTYSSKRESNHGAYRSNGTDWNEEIYHINAAQQLNEMLHITRQGDTLTKYNSNHSLLYRLHNISFAINNPDLHSKQTLKATISLTFEMPITFGNLHHTIMVPMSVTAENKQKY